MTRVKTPPVGPKTNPKDRRLQEEGWRQILKKQERSGLRATEFCRKNSIPPPRLFFGGSARLPSETAGSLGQ